MASTTSESWLVTTLVKGSTQGFEPLDLQASGLSGCPSLVIEDPASAMSSLYYLAIELLDDWKATCMLLFQIFNLAATFLRRNYTPLLTTICCILTIGNLALRHSISTSPQNDHEPCRSEISVLRTRIEALSHHFDKQLFRDGTGLMDYASIGLGARVITALTSKTYGAERQSAPWYGWWTRQRFEDTLSALPPEVAILQDTQVGSCWPMKGRNGTLGIALAHPVTVTSFTIDHVPLQLTPRYHNAPRDGDLWGLIDHPSAAALSRSNLTLLALSTPSDIFPDISRIRDTPYANLWMVHLGSFTFDVHAGRPYQTFRIPVNTLQQLGTISLRIVVDMET
ncbi:hypothetical protein NUW54_g1166 [Trametes sanguinea]|uniref:Uncharacterized protein n=1 Tax=Trametes sanguinea TaxID=158606 RepID=A0ACC1Q733_9APHY|nr:hypothetical protein NUW54_g1166 [Trametes sanguinea]